jgi:hypothetical protein
VLDRLGHDDRDAARSDDLRTIPPITNDVPDYQAPAAVTTDAR